jgi:hypothetical protein
VFIVPDNSRAINRVFTRGVIADLIEHGSSKVFDVVVQRYINDPETKTHGQIISEIYAHLGREHRNEYYYMNTLLNKLLVGIHSVNSTTALSQVRIGGHIADFVMINGEGRVYEIKSDLDNYDRLYDQLSDFYKAFSMVSVLADVHSRDNIARLLAGFGEMGESVGIYTLTERDTIFGRATVREPKSFDENLDHICIFKLLRKREYENLLLQLFGELPQVPPVFYFRACLERFCQMPIKDAQQMAFGELKKRNKISKTVFERIQPELKSTVYFAGLSKKLPQLEGLLQSTYRG